MDLMLRQKIEDYHKEELADHEKYCQLADSLEKEYPHVAGVLRDIAWEEKSHAELMNYIIKKLNK